MAGTTQAARLAAAFTTLTLLAGCGHSPPTQFFTLDPVAPARTSAADVGPVLRIDRVTVPAVLDRPELVRELRADQLTIDDFSHWGAPLGDLMRIALIEDLTARLPSGRVLPASAQRVDGAADLAVDVTAVHESGVAVTAEVDWTITQRGPATAGAPPQIARRVRHERIEAPLNGGSQQAFAAALSQTISLLADRIAESLPASSGS